MLVDNWATDELDEGIALAQLDMLATVILNSPRPDWLPNTVQEAAERLVRQISENHPQAVGTRPVMRWMLIKTLESSFQDTESGTSVDPFAYLNYCPGVVLKRDGCRIGLPIYIPFEFEVPGWFVPQASKEVRLAVETTLAQATRVQDYPTQVLCHQLLIMQTQDPSDLFDRLGQLQSSVMGDMEGYLRTCLSSYLICRGKEAEKRLLAQLKQLDGWTELNALRDADVHLAKQQIERVLDAKINGQRVIPPLRRSAMTYYAWLSESALGFLEKVDSPSAASKYGSATPGKSEHITIREAKHPESPPRYGWKQRNEWGPEERPHHRESDREGHDSSDRVSDESSDSSNESHDDDDNSVLVDVYQDMDIDIDVNTNEVHTIEIPFNLVREKRVVVIVDHRDEGKTIHWSQRPKPTASDSHKTTHSGSRAAAAKTKSEQKKQDGDKGKGKGSEIPEIRIESLEEARRRVVTIESGEESDGPGSRVRGERSSRAVRY